MLPMAVGLLKIPLILWRVYILKFSILLAMWEIFKYLYLARNKVQNRFYELNFRYYRNLYFIVHLEKEPKSISFTCYNFLWLYLVVR